MGKAVVFTNVDFSTQALAQVQLLSEIKCTEIELSQNSVTMTKIGQKYTLTPTLYPANTTTSVKWSSSNPAVATVNGGVVTEVGIGTTTITAMADGHTATCTVTTTNILSTDWSVLTNYSFEVYPGRDYASIYTTSGNYYGVAYSTKSVGHYAYNANTVFPIVLGDNATTLEISAPNTLKVTVWFCDSTVDNDYSQLNTNNSWAHMYTKVVSGDASAYDGNVPLGNRTISIPQNQGVDSVFIAVRDSNGTISTTTFDSVTVTAK